MTTQPTTPAPVDPALTQRIAAVIRHALKTLTAPALTDYAGRPISGTEIGLSEYDIADVALAELAPELARAEVARLRQRLEDAHTEGARLARLLGDMRRERDDERQRAEQAETALTRVRQLADRWENALAPDLAYARALRTALTGPAEENTP